MQEIIKQMGHLGRAFGAFVGNPLSHLSIWSRVRRHSLETGNKRWDGADWMNIWSITTTLTIGALLASSQLLEWSWSACSNRFLAKASELCPHLPSCILLMLQTGFGIGYCQDGWFGSLIMSSSGCYTEVIVGGNSNICPTLDDEHVCLKILKLICSACYYLHPPSILGQKERQTWCFMFWLMFPFPRTVLYHSCFYWPELLTRQKNKQMKQIAFQR